MTRPTLTRDRSHGEELAADINTERSARTALACLSLPILLSSLSTSIANVALPALGEAFDASFQAVQWVVLAYLLAITTLVVSLGRLGDLTGRRRLLLGGILLFVVGSGLSGVSPTLWLLIPARFVQGVGAAIMMALSMAFVGELVAKDKIGRAMGLLGTMSAFGTALGPSLGGVLISVLGWQSIFLINVPLGALALLLARNYLPGDDRSPKQAPIRFDNRGTALLAFTLGAYALAMTLGRGDFGALNGGLLAIAVLGACLFIVAESRAENPLVPLGVFQSPVRNAGLSVSALVSTVMMATLVVGPFYLSQSLGLDAFLVGAIMSVGPLAAALSSAPAGRAADRLGAERMTVVGLAAIGFGSLALSLAPATYGVAGYVGPLVVMTVGYALFQTANNTAVMRDIDPGRRGLVSGMLNLSRNLGLITGASVMGAIFVLGSRSVDVRTAPADAVAAGMHVTFGVAAGLICVAVALMVGTRSAVARTARP